MGQMISSSSEINLALKSHDIVCVSGDEITFKKSDLGLGSFMIADNQDLPSISSNPFRQLMMLQF